MRRSRVWALFGGLVLLVAACGGGGSDAKPPVEIPLVSVVPTTSSTTTTVAATTTTTVAATTTTTAKLLDFESPECTVLQAAFWFASDAADISAFSESTLALPELESALGRLRVPTAGLFDQQGVVAISNWLIDQLDGTVIVDDNGDLATAPLILCSDIAGEAIIVDPDIGEDVSGGFSQIYAGRFNLPGKGRLFGGSRENPVPFGETSNVGDWEVRVVDTDPDGWDRVRAENQFNDPPGLGHAFYIVKLSATYVGPDSELFWLDVDWSALGPSNVAYDQFGDSCGVLPNGISDVSEAFTGGVVTGNICFDVLIDDAADLVMFMEAGFDGDRVFFALS